MVTRAELVVCAAALLSGAAWWLSGAERPLLVSGLLVLAAGVCQVRRRGVAAALLLGFLAGALRARGSVAPALPADHLGALVLPRNATVWGVVAEPLRQFRYGGVFVLSADQVDDGEGRRPIRGKIRVTLRRVHRHWRVGERVRLRSRLRRPRGFHNPGSFDLAGHLARADIHVTASAWERGAVAHEAFAPRGWRVRLERWRQRLGMTISHAALGRDGAVLTALVIGDDAGLDDDTRTAFTRAGVIHVLSVSGLHLALVGWVTQLATRWLLGRSERALLSLDITTVAAVVSLAPVAGYAVLAGARVATLRAAVMQAVAAVALLSGRRVHVWTTLAVAAAGLTLWSPSAPLEPAFQLSFVSVLGLLLADWRWPAAPHRRGIWPRAKRALLYSASATLATIPLTAWHFHQMTLIGAGANVLIIPLFESVPVGLGLTGAFVEPWCPTLAAHVFSAAGMFLQVADALVCALGRLRWAAVDVPIPNTPELMLVYVGLAALLVKTAPQRRRLLLAVAVGALLDGAYWVHVRWAPGILRASFLDVGQGDAAVVELPDGRVMVLDAGGFPASSFDPGAAVAGPYLWTRKIMRIDVLVMSHAHPDHAGGLAYLIEHFAPREFWWNGVPGEGAQWERLTRTLARAHVPIRVLRAGEQRQLGQVTLATLHPGEQPGALSLNDGSLVVAVSWHAIRLLLTGDIEAAGEAAVLKQAPLLESTVVKVAHHGSRSSSQAAFVAAARPRIAVISVGSDNAYRLPSPEVEERYRAAGACVLRTDRCGASIVVASAGDILMHTADGCVCAPVAPGAR